jgi:hypothetical protein
MRTFAESAVRFSAALAVCTLLATGCNKHADNTLNFTNAINTYYSTHPACLWPSSTQFPAQVNNSDTDKTAPYDALVDQGLLARTTAEKKVMIIASKQVTNYDLSEKGRAAWTPDVNQPGFGNFCYGHRKVLGIDNVAPSPTSDAVGATAQITYRYGFVDSPAWATATETQNAFPNLRSELSGNHVGQATLTNTPNGWAVTSPSATP